MKIAEMSNKNRHSAVKKLTEASMLSAFKTAQAKPKVVVVHAAPPRDHDSRCAWMYRAGAGTNPRGPRGGTCGNMVAGRWVSGDYYEKSIAEAVAKEYAEENGYEYQAR